MASAGLRVITTCRLGSTSEVNATSFLRDSVTTVPATTSPFFAFKACSRASMFSTVTISSFS